MSELKGKAKVSCWTDFDGTATKKYGKLNPRNWLKYPLDGIHGYLDFFEGVQQAGVDFAGVISIRKENIKIRRWATERSIRNLGYAGLIKPGMFKYAGTEEAKGLFLATESMRGTYGMIDDRPHAFGVQLLRAFDVFTPAVSSSEAAQFHPVLLGVVEYGGKGQKRIERLGEEAEDLKIAGLTVNETGVAGSIGLAIRTPQVTLDVVQLEPYSFEAGQAFGDMLYDLAA